MVEKETKQAKSDKLEREYIIPLRKAWLKVPMYERTGKAIKAIKIFLAKHMKVEDRDVKNVRIDVYLNNELWYKGRTNPPAKVKVKAIKEKGIVTVNFVDVPEHVKFLKTKHEKLQKSLDSRQPKEQPKTETKTETKSESKETKTDEQKKDEKEKGLSSAESKEKQFESKAKEQKHVPKLDKQKSHPVRMALQK